MEISHPTSSAIVTRASQCHQMPQALRRPQRTGDEHDDAEQTAIYRGRAAIAVGRRAIPSEQVERARDAADERPPVNIAIPRRRRGSRRSSDTSPIVDSYGALAIMTGAYANIAAASDEQRREHLPHGAYSVMSGSNVQSASVTKTTSNASRMRDPHARRRLVRAATAAARAVPRTPAMITGTVIGYNRIGSMTSRDRARTSIAANSVPTAANPTVPHAAARRAAAAARTAARWNSSATSGTSSDLGDDRAAARMPSSLPT